jgi:hypothetical protein
MINERLMFKNGLVPYLVLFPPKTLLYRLL